MEENEKEGDEEANEDEDEAAAHNEVRTQMQI